MPFPSLLLFFTALVGIRAVLAATDSPPRPIRIMAVGDSITAGADFFSNYRYPLWEKLFGAGYVVEFVGTQKSDTRVGSLAHEGYGGKNTEYLAENVPAHFRDHPANVVLLHSGHNHTVEEQPVPGIVAATEKLIASFRAVNPRVTVLLAQVIPAGKLPKYSYLPELNGALAALAARLDQPDQRVVIVDQTAGFNWRTDTVEDKVHPNAQGAEKMASAWFAALKKILPAPARTFAPRKVTYRTVGDTALQLHVFDAKAGGKLPRPAIVFFFAGGWTQGTPLQFYAECAHFAGRGYVAISADYRLTSAKGATPFDAIEDARAALKWVHDHASELGLDPKRIVAAGASAGGHLAAITALGNDAPDRVKPAALVLWYPILDTSPAGFGHALFGEEYRRASPVHLVERALGAVGPANAAAPNALQGVRSRDERAEGNALRLPPTLLLFGDADSATPLATVKKFQDHVRAAGGRCELVVYPGGGHPLYAYRAGGGPFREATLAEADRFLDTVWSER